MTTNNDESLLSNVKAYREENAGKKTHNNRKKRDDVNKLQHV